MVNKTLEFLINKFKPEIQKRGGTEIHGVSRTIMAQTLGELGFKEGVEVGVAQGWHAEILCKENPGVKLHCVDVWDQIPGYKEYEKTIDIFYKEAQENLAKFNAPLIRKYSMDAVKDFADNSLDFVYIDGAHDFKNVAMDICEWSKKVKVGGIVFGHDYKRWKRHAGGSRRYVVDVKDVVDAYMYAHGIKPWFVLTNDTRDPKFGRDNPGWLFVRQDTDLI